MSARTRYKLAPHLLGMSQRRQIVPYASLVSQGGTTELLSRHEMLTHDGNLLDHVQFTANSFKSCLRQMTESGSVRTCLITTVQ